MSRERDRDVRLAVVTGRHPFDVRGFAELFRSIEGIDAYIQHMEDFSADPAGLRDWYDVVLFYNMHTDTPTGEGPWYEAGIKAALERLGQTEQGICVLHHAILAFTDWRPWAELVGIQDRGFGFHIGETVQVQVADGEHPITEGLQGWEMIDETYAMADAGQGSHVLLTTDHPKSMHTIAWTREYGKARVFCFQSGHDNQAWAQTGFRQTLTRGILWAAGRAQPST